MSYTGLLTQTITIWIRGAADGTGGYAYNNPATISSRYQDENTNQIDIDGEDFISTGIVYTSTQYKIGDWMYKGTSVEADPQLVSGAYRIRNIYTTQNPSASIIVYRNILGK